MHRADPPCRISVKQAAGAAPFRTVLSRHGQAQRCEIAVDVPDAPAADQCDCAARGALQLPYHVHDFGLDPNLVGHFGEIDQRAIEIQKPRGACGSHDRRTRAHSAYRPIVLSPAPPLAARRRIAHTAFLPTVAPPPNAKRLRLRIAAASSSMRPAQR